MFNTAQPRKSVLVCYALLATLLAGCDGAPEVPAGADGDEVSSAMAHETGAAPGRDGALPAAVNRELARLREATAGFHDLELAKEAGYEVLVTHPETGAECLSHGTMGGMGFHYLNPDLVGPDVEVDRPQVILYEEGPNGRRHMVAAEYIIPFAIRGTDEAPPVLFGQEFVQNHTFDVWALHVWVWKNNPSGMFADYNPRVSCD